MVGDKLKITELSYKQCLDNESWSKIKPLGMNLIVHNFEVLSGDQYQILDIIGRHPKVNKRATFKLRLPIFEENVISWRNSTKALLHAGDVLVDSDFDICMDIKDESERMDIHVTTPYEIAIKEIEAAIANGLRNWFHDKEPDVNEDIIQAFVDKWFSSGSQWRVLKYSKIAQEDQQHGIILGLFPKGNSHNDRMLSRVFNPKLWDIIDLNSTSISDKVNESFRFIHDDSPFCKVLAKHSIGLWMNPRRAYLLRNTFEQAVDLVNNELPLVTPYEDDEVNPLNGLNLETALMHYDHMTHEDGIVISESAASKFVAARTITQLVESNLEVKPLVKEGDPITSTTPIAVDGDRQILASKTYFPGKVSEIVISNGSRFGVITNRCWFKFETYYPLLHGDKLSNRHGGKGVVTVIPDQDMPYYLDNEGNKKHVEVCIGPETVVNRKAMSLLWEMMLSKKAKETGSPIKVDLYSKDGNQVDWPSGENYSFSSLADKYGDKQQLYLNGNKLEETTFVSDLFWLRIDKFAKEIISVCKDKRKMNNFKAVVDDAKASGQRCNPAKLLALSARDMTDVAGDIIDNNMSGKQHFTNLIDAVKNEKFTL